MTQSVRSNWRGFPCPSCGAALQAARELGRDGEQLRVLLRCPDGHCWEERFSLRTEHSNVCVERRPDLEAPGLEPEADPDAEPDAEPRHVAASRHV